jgi:hypothetical protein
VQGLLARAGASTPLHSMILFDFLEKCLAFFNDGLYIYFHAIALAFH